MAAKAASRSEEGWEKITESRQVIRQAIAAEALMKNARELTRALVLVGDPKHSFTFRCLPQ